MFFADEVGLLGVLLVMIAYVLLQFEKLTADHMTYSVLNALGSAMIIYSLLFKWNLSAFAMEGAWLVVSLYGCVKVWRARKSNKLS